MRHITRYLLTGVFLLTGCGQNDLTGHWENVDTHCQHYCTLTIRVHPDTHKTMLMFDNQFTERGYRYEHELKHQSKNRYMLLLPDSEPVEIIIEDEKMIMESGITFKKLHLRRRPICCKAV